MQSDQEREANGENNERNEEMTVSENGADFSSIGHESVRH
jgi:hypothetical protein